MRAGLSNVSRMRCIVPTQMADIGACRQCNSYRDLSEIEINYGLCDDCFEEDCPCNENKPNSCPLHPWPDVVLNFG